MKQFYTEDKFGLLIDVHSMADQAIHGSGARLVNTKDGVQLEIECHDKGSDVLNCHIFVTSDSSGLLSTAPQTR